MSKAEELRKWVNALEKAIADVASFLDGDFGKGRSLLDTALVEARREALLWAVAELEKRIQSEAETGSPMNAVAHIRKEAQECR